jgi:hypothetical protein
MDGGILERVMIVGLSVRDSERILFCVHMEFDAEECMRRVCNSATMPVGSIGNVCLQWRGVAWRLVARMRRSARSGFHAGPERVAGESVRGPGDGADRSHHGGRRGG